MKIILRITMLIAVVVATGNIAEGSMPPHPRLRQLIAEGKVAEPYYLRHLDELRARGLNAPWAAPALELQRAMAPAAPARLLGPALAPGDSFRALIILVDFSDKAQQVQPAFFDTLVFEDTSGMVHDYFKAVSYGAFDVVSVDLPSGTGWTRAPQNYAYYVNAENGLGIDSYPNNAQKLVEDVVTAVDSLVDFSQYDNDGDGYVDALFVVHAGPGAEFTGDSTDVWSHAWATYKPISLDGVNVWRYSMEPEYWDTPGDMTIGVFAHEMGHSVFGLPDLYDTDDSSEGVGDWSLMAGGSWNGALGDSPAFPDAWCHIQMGYIDPINVTSNEAGAVIAAVEDSAEVRRLWTYGAVGKQYFLVENRQQTGYDAALPGSGLLIYHVDEQQLLPVDDPPQNDNEWYPGHTSSGHYLVALEQADGLWDLEQAPDYPYSSSDNGDPYPGISGNTTFDFSSTPSSKDYNANDTYVAVRNISASGLDMTADFFVVPDTVAPAHIVAVNDIPNDQGGWITVTWSASADDSSSSPNPVLFYSIWFEDAGGGDAAPPLTVRLPEGSVPESVTLAVEGWIGVGSLGATQDPIYCFLVHTLQDSNQTGTNWTYLRISAHTDSGIYSFSAVDSGYSVDNLGPSVSVGLADGPGVPEAFALRQNYPNPFNPGTTIRFDVPVATSLSLVVYDILGREVIPMARRHAADALTALGGHPVVREGFVTDNGNLILDVHGLAIPDPARLEAELDHIAGVVCNGLFARRLADLLLAGTRDGVTILP